MKLTDDRKQKLEAIFEDIFTTEQALLNDAFRNENTPFYESLIKFALIEQGFPKNASHKTVDLDVDIKSDVNYDTWAMLYWREEGMRDYPEDESVFESKISQHNSFINRILDNTTKIKFDVTIYDTVDDYLDYHPNMEHWLRKIEGHFDPDHYRNELIENFEIYILNELNDKIKEESFDIEPLTSLDTDLDWDIQVEHSPNLTPFAEHEFNLESVPNTYASVSDYLKSSHFYEDVINSGLVRWEIKILSDPEDFE